MKYIKNEKETKNVNKINVFHLMRTFFLLLELTEYWMCEWKKQLLTTEWKSLSVGIYHFLPKSNEHYTGASTFTN